MSDTNDTNDINDTNKCKYYNIIYPIIKNISDINISEDRKIIRHKMFLLYFNKFKEQKKYHFFLDYMYFIEISSVFKNFNLPQEIIDIIFNKCNLYKMTKYIHQLSYEHTMIKYYFTIENSFPKYTKLFNFYIKLNLERDVYGSIINYYFDKLLNDQKKFYKFDISQYSNYNNIPGLDFSNLEYKN